MKLRAISLLAVTLILAAAPAAMANCLRCHKDNNICIIVTYHGYELCGWDPWGVCFTQDACGGIGLAPTDALASEYDVVAVERLDDLQPKTGEALVASNEGTAHTFRSARMLQNNTP